MTFKFVFKRGLLGWLLCFGLSFSAIAITDSEEQSVKTALKANDWNEALDVVEKLIDDNPDDSKAHFLHAYALRVKMQNVSKVRSLFSVGDYKDALAKAIELDSKNIDARTEEIGFYLMAPAVAGGDVSYAIERINALKKIDVYQAMFMEIMLAQVNEDEANRDEILAALLRMKPNDPQALMLFASLKMQKKAYLEADAAFAKVIDEEGKSWSLMALYQRAKWRIVAKESPDQAIEFLIAYIDKLPNAQGDLGFPNKAAALWRLALAYENKGDIPKAIELIKASAKLDKSIATKDLKRLKRLKNN